MIKVFFGNDLIAIRQTAFKAAEETGFRTETIDLARYESGWFASLANSVSLFEGPVAYIVDTPSEYSEADRELQDALSVLAESANHFVIIEGPLLAAERKVYEKYAESVKEFKTAAKTRFNTFSLADALATRDRKKLWLLWHEAKRNGIASEELIGILWWQLKSIRLAAVTKNADEAGMKDFSYQKARRALAKLPKEDAESLSHSLINLLHQSRLGLVELDIAIEWWILRG